MNERRTPGASMRRRLIGVIAGAGGFACAVLLGNKALTWASAALLAAFVSTMAQGQQASVAATQVSAEPDAEIVRVAESYRKAVLDADLPTLTALYRDDAVEMPFFQHSIAGRAAIQGFYEGLFKGPVKVAEFSFVHLETIRHGDVAYDVGTYNRHMSGAPTGPVEATGNYIVILKRNSGAWQIAYLMYNCDCAPGTAPSAASR